MSGGELDSAASAGSLVAPVVLGQVECPVGSGREGDEVGGLIVAAVMVAVVDLPAGRDGADLTGVDGAVEELAGTRRGLEVAAAGRASPLAATPPDDLGAWEEAMSGHA